MNEKFLGDDGLAELWKLMTQYVDGKIFIGTQDEYNKIENTIEQGTIVIIIDTPLSNSNKLILGQSILGLTRLN